MRASSSLKRVPAQLRNKRNARGCQLVSAHCSYIPQPSHGRALQHDAWTRSTAQQSAWLPIGKLALLISTAAIAHSVSAHGTYQPQPPHSIFKRTGF